MIVDVPSLVHVTNVHSFIANMSGALTNFLVGVDESSVASVFNPALLLTRIPGERVLSSPDVSCAPTISCATSILSGFTQTEMVNAFVAAANNPCPILTLSLEPSKSSAPSIFPVTSSSSAMFCAIPSKLFAESSIVVSEATSESLRCHTPL